MGKHKKQITRRDGRTQSYWVGTDTAPPTAAPSQPGSLGAHTSMWGRLMQKFATAPDPMSQQDLDVETAYDMAEYEAYRAAQPSTTPTPSRWDWDPSGHADPATDASPSEAWSFDDASGAD